MQVLWGIRRLYQATHPIRDVKTHINTSIINHFIGHAVAILSPLVVVNQKSKI
jgi:hypothetical protein